MREPRYLYTCKLCGFEIRHDGSFPEQAACLESIQEHQRDRHDEAPADFDIVVGPKKTSEAE